PGSTTLPGRPRAWPAAAAATTTGSARRRRWRCGRPLPAGARPVGRGEPFRPANPGRVPRGLGRPRPRPRLAGWKATPTPRTAGRADTTTMPRARPLPRRTRRPGRARCPRVGKSWVDDDRWTTYRERVLELVRTAPPNSPGTNQGGYRVE